MDQNIKKWFPFSTYDIIDDHSEKLICFHYAGGSASVFRQWTLEPHGFNVLCAELPGKGTRTGEAFVTDIKDLLEPLCAAVDAVVENGKYTLFGHSMGAAIGFYVADRMTKNYGKQPSCLIVAGRQAPDTENEGEFKSWMSDDALIKEMRMYGGTPDDVLENKELMDILIPRIRKDYELNDTLIYHGEKLHIPIVAHSALEDKGATPDIMEHWSAMTTGKFSIRSFEGRHFWVTDDETYFLQILKELEGTNHGNSEN